MRRVVGSGTAHTVAAERVTGSARCGRCEVGRGGARPGLLRLAAEPGPQWILSAWRTRPARLLITALGV